MTEAELQAIEKRIKDLDQGGGAEYEIWLFAHAYSDLIDVLAEVRRWRELYDAVRPRSFAEMDDLSRATGDSQHSAGRALESSANGQNDVPEGSEPKPDHTQF